MNAQVAVLAVAEKGSFQAAGKYLGISKSAVRKRVQSIEGELGAPVFRIVGKRLMPTEAGNLYILAARESVRQAFLGIDRVQAYLRVQEDELRIGYSTYLNTRLLEIVRRLQPEGISSLSVSRESLTTQHAVAGVLQGELHVGFGILPILDTDITSRLLFEEPLMACLPVGHRFATKSTIQPEDLEEEPVVAVSRKTLPGRHQDIVRHFESLGVSLKFVTDAFSIKEALWLVTQGLGLTLLTRYSASSHRHEIVIRPFSASVITLKPAIRYQFKTGQRDWPET
jgi:LysR family hca operon transcriptional activator